MCVIIAKKAGVKPVPREYLERAWDRNSDGGGVVFFRPGDECAYMKKGMMNKKEFIDYLEKINKEENSFIAHFRIKSKGKVCKMNTHPFCYEHITFAHNGTLSCVTPAGDMTDSQAYGDKFFVGKTINWIKSSKELIEMTLGYSKFAIMDNHTGEIVILNKQNGQEKDGVWYSNDSPFRDNSYPQYPTAGSRTTGTTAVTKTTSQTTKKPNAAEKENGATDETLSELMMTKNFLGTPEWSPNKVYIIYDRTRKMWINRNTNGVVTPLMYNNLAFSREGLYRIISIDQTGLTPCVDGQPEYLKDLRKFLWSSYQGFLQECRNGVHYEDIEDAAEQARTLWLCHNVVHQLVSNYMLVNMENLKKVLFDKKFFVGNKSSQSLTVDDVLDVVEEQLEEFFMEHDAQLLV